MTRRTTKTSINRGDLHTRCESHALSTRTLEANAFVDALAEARGLCRRRGLPLSIVMLDLDRTSPSTETPKKSFSGNVVRRFASILSAVCGDRDFVSRRYGDRFVVALPESDSGEARELIDRCRRAMTADSQIRVSLR